MSGDQVAQGNGGPGAGDVEEWSYRPVWTSACVVVIAVAMVVLAAVAWFTLPEDSRATFATSERVTLVAFGLVPLVLAVRLAMLKVAATPAGLVVRNIVRVTRLPWAQISALRFASGDAWLMVFDADGRRLGVLAVQRAEGSRATSAATELAAYARAHGAGPQNVRPGA